MNSSCNLYAVLLCIASLSLTGPTASSQSSHLVEILPTDSKVDIIGKAAAVRPSPKQMAWQKMELTAFLHFGINTFTNREWGDGKEDPQLFNPTQLDARQWVKTCKEAGMKLIILTTKHHDGFCLWPSQYTEHSVKNSPWKNGKGDVVRELADACSAEGMKLGVYLSPWDRNSPIYGTAAYNDYFVKQLTELLTKYGEIAEVWFDGANGEGPNGKKQVYDWQRYYQTIRRLQPEAVIAIMGPDVRWVGTESGYGRDTEWSVVPASMQDEDKVAANSQQKAGTFRPKLDPMAKDLGSREKLYGADRLVWYPSEVDVSIRPGWFYHQDQDDKVKSVEKLLDIYYSSVGKNSLLLLNIPPDTRGLIHENDVNTLTKWRQTIDATFKTNLAKGARIRQLSNEDLLWDAKLSTHYMAKKERPVFKIKLNGVQVFDRLVLQENIALGQRVEAFKLEGKVNGRWEEISSGTTIGYKRILRFPTVKAKQLRLSILSSRAKPALAAFGLYKSAQ